MASELWSDDSIVGYPALIKSLKGALLIGFETYKIAYDNTNAAYLRRGFRSFPIYYGRSWEGNRQRGRACGGQKAL